MRIGKVGKDDWPHFLRWARGEGWRVTAAEVELFRGDFADSFHRLGEEGERPLAFLSAVAYGRVGWIGNLIVRPDRRGRGLGTLLFEYGAQKLKEDGCASLWLTASPMGRSLYERRGFRRLDSVVRWRGEGSEAAENSKEGRILNGSSEMTVRSGGRRGGRCSIYWQVGGGSCAAEVASPCSRPGRRCGFWAPGSHPICARGRAGL